VTAGREKAERVAARAREFALTSWEEARREPTFEDAARRYAALLTEALYRAFDQMEP